MIETKSNIGNISKVLKTGKTPPSKNEAYFKKDYNWFTPGDISNTKYISSSERHISELALKDRKAFLYPSNSILITCIGNIGRVGISKEECASNQQITAIEPMDEVHVDYLYYWFIANQKLLQDKSNSAVVPILNNKSLREVAFNYPPLKTQQHIAQILDDAAALRDKTKQLLTEYDLLAQSIFLEMFGDPVINPKRWKASTIEKVCVKILGGGTPRKNNEEYYNGDIPWVTPKDMKKLYINNSKIKITQKGVSESSVKLIPENSILMVIRSGILKKKLPIAMSTSEVTINQDMKAFIANGNIVNPKYLMFFFLNAQNYLLAKVRAVTADNIEFNEIKKMKIPLPELSLQKQFAEKITLIEQQKELAQQELKESEDLFNSLLQKAFKGELK